MKKIIALLLLSSLVLSCVKEDEGPQTMFLGSQLNIGNGKVWTFVELDATDLPCSFLQDTRSINEKLRRKWCEKLTFIGQ